MFFRKQTNQLSVQCPEQGGTGMRSMPERDGTGATRMPEQGGTGIRRLGQFFALLCLALPTAALHAQGESWPMSGEANGSAQISIGNDQHIQMGFMLPAADGALRHFTAIGPIKSGFAKLQLFLIDVDGRTAELVPYGSVELFLDACGADGEMQIKSEADGSGGKTLDSLVFSMTSPNSACTGKSEADGSGTP